MAKTVSAIASFTAQTNADLLKHSDLNKAVNTLCSSDSFSSLLLSLIEAPAFSVELNQEFKAADRVSGLSACRRLRSALNFSLGRFFGLLAEHSTFHSADFLARFQS